MMRHLALLAVFASCFAAALDADAESGSSFEGADSSEDASPAPQSSSAPTLGVLDEHGALPEQSNDSTISQTETSTVDTSAVSKNESLPESSSTLDAAPSDNSSATVVSHDELGNNNEDEANPGGNIAVRLHRAKPTPAAEPATYIAPSTLPAMSSNDSGAGNSSPDAAKAAASPSAADPSSTVGAPSPSEAMAAAGEGGTGLFSYFFGGARAASAPSPVVDVSVPAAMTAGSAPVAPSSSVAESMVEGTPSHAQDAGMSSGAESSNLSDVLSAEGAANVSAQPRLETDHESERLTQHLHPENVEWTATGDNGTNVAEAMDDGTEVSLLNANGTNVAEAMDNGTEVSLLNATISEVEAKPTGQGEGRKLGAPAAVDENGDGHAGVSSDSSVDGGDSSASKSASHSENTASVDESSSSSAVSDSSGSNELVQQDTVTELEPNGSYRGSNETNTTIPDAEIGTGNGTHTDPEDASLFYGTIGINNAANATLSYSTESTPDSSNKDTVSYDVSVSADGSMEPLFNAPGVEVVEQHEDSVGIVRNDTALPASKDIAVPTSNATGPDNVENSSGLPVGIPVGNSTSSSFGWNTSVPVAGGDAVVCGVCAAQMMELQARLVAAEALCGSNSSGRNSAVDGAVWAVLSAQAFGQGWWAESVGILGRDGKEAVEGVATQAAAAGAGALRLALSYGAGPAAVVKAGCTSALARIGAQRRDILQWMAVGGGDTADGSAIAPALPQSLRPYARVGVDSVLFITAVLCAWLGMLLVWPVVSCVLDLVWSGVTCRCLCPCRWRKKGKGETLAAGGSTAESTYKQGHGQAATAAAVTPLQVGLYAPPPPAGYPYQPAGGTSMHQAQLAQAQRPTVAGTGTPGSIRFGSGNMTTVALPPHLAERWAAGQGRGGTAFLPSHHGQGQGQTHGQAQETDFARRLSAADESVTQSDLQAQYGSGSSGSAGNVLGGPGVAAAAPMPMFMSSASASQGVGQSGSQQRRSQPPTRQQPVMPLHSEPLGTGSASGTSSATDTGPSLGAGSGTSGQAQAQALAPPWQVTGSGNGRGATLGRVPQSPAQVPPAVSMGSLFQQAPPPPSPAQSQVRSAGAPLQLQRQPQHQQQRP